MSSRLENDLDRSQRRLPVWKMALIAVSGVSVFLCLLNSNFYTLYIIYTPGILSPLRGFIVFVVSTRGLTHPVCGLSHLRRCCCFLSLPVRWLAPRLWSVTPLGLLLLFLGGRPTLLGDSCSSKNEGRPTAKSQSTPPPLGGSGWGL